MTYFSLKSLKKNVKKENGSIYRGERKRQETFSSHFAKRLDMFFSKMVPCSQSPFLYDQAPSVADAGGGGGVGGLNTPLRGVFFACQYMKIPADLDPNPSPLEEFRPRTPPPPPKNSAVRP